MLRGGQDGIGCNAGAVADSSNASATHGFQMGNGAAAGSSAPRVWVVIGASRGIGFEYARQVRSHITMQRIQHALGSLCRPCR